ncbi:NUDIX domain-containing protein [Ralstonia pseudosolanacearum]|uniref:NUDIX domain-containing protein n=1 Tax=Ralstonia pseudosolanacearum TaxID=1310165 RepID=UPI003C2D4D49
MKEAVRAIAWSPLGLILIRRDRPGQSSYFVLPGGGIELEDRTAEDALQRELLEELGAKPEGIRLLTALDRRPDGIGKIEYFFECLIPSITLTFTGDEARDPERGGYRLVIIRSRDELDAVPLLPASVKALILAKPHFGY